MYVLLLCSMYYCLVYFNLGIAIVSNCIEMSLGVTFNCVMEMLLSHVLASKIAVASACLQYLQFSIMCSWIFYKFYDNSCLEYINDKKAEKERGIGCETDLSLHTF